MSNYFLLFFKKNNYLDYIVIFDISMDMATDRSENIQANQMSTPVEHPNIQASLTGNSSLHKVGRPSKCTPEILTEIQFHIMQGLTAAKACQLVDVHIDTYHRWLKDVPEFNEACEKARSERIITWIRDGCYNKDANANFIRFLLQSHPDTRDDFKPPISEQNIDLKTEIKSPREVLEKWKERGIEPVETTGEAPTLIPPSASLPPG